MKKVRNIFLLSLVLCTVICYMSVWVSPAWLKLSAGISILIPVFLLINLVVFILFLIRRSSRALVPFVLLLIGYPFIQVSFSVGNSAEKEGDFSLLSYNVRWFEGGQKQGGNVIYDFIGQQSADIVCLQEFYAVRSDLEKLSKKGNYEPVINTSGKRLAILSKFPVLRSGVLLENNNFNNIQFADLLIAKGDTLRVYNLHLKSMGINASKLQNTEDIREEYEDVKTKFLGGAAVRAEQISVLLDHLATCTYRVVISGDFNDVPFSYNHFQLRSRFDNAFEAAGSGFGITYNGRLPFLRIDHQFFNEGLEALSFRTFNDVNYSDHFPILGIYALSP